LRRLRRDSGKIAMRFAKDYVDHVLRQNFEDFRTLFLPYLLDIHYAHLVMLHRIGLLRAEEARGLAKGLNRIAESDLDEVVYDGAFEDAFCLVEEMLAGHCGGDVAGRLHTARSRNDIDVTLYRLRWREELSSLQGAVVDLRAVLLAICRREIDTLVPLYTHAQAAQPSTIAHYLHAVAEHLERDHERLSRSLTTLNRCPLGSCAITGTGFPIDRRLTARLLAFDGPTGNTYGSIGGADYLLEPIAAVQVLLNMLGRAIQDLLLWTTSEFRFLRLADEFVQPSSIMPQKRNPVALEHARALAGRALGQGAAVFQMLHNTPFGDVVDLEDDLQPLVDRTLRDARAAVALTTAALGTARFERERLAEKAAEHWITATDLADFLVSEEGLSFRDAHRVVSAVVRALESGSAASVREALLAAGRSVLERDLDRSEEELRRVLCPREFVNRRKTEGGPAPEVMAEALDRADARLAEDRRRLEDVAARFAGYRDQLRALAGRILG
jgi:argininosuccinate lyase